jgi:RHH-type transcriptional regulator, rel operon repressor / antitoxin RelB
MGYMYPTKGKAMSKQTAIRLPDETYTRLQTLAARTGRTATFYIREAVEAHIQDLEDLYAAEQALITHRASGKQPLSLDQLDAELGLDS